LDYEDEAHLSVSKPNDVLPLGAVQFVTVYDTQSMKSEER